MQGPKDITRKIQRKFSKRLISFFIIAFFYLSFVYFFEKNKCFDIVAIVDESFIESLFNIVSVMSTILAASVIFFYSIQDNYKVGIPHRSIMAYTYGEYTILIIFLIVLIIQPVILIFMFMKMKLVSLIMVAITFILQIMLIVCILLTTDFNFYTNAIFNAEIRQFLLLSELGRKEDDSKGLIWPYLLKHMMGLLQGNELSHEKADFFQKLLRVPFYKTEQSIFYFKFRKLAPQFVYNEEFFDKDKKWELYCFYYNNLLSVFEYLSEDNKSEERNSYYDMLYLFIKDIDTLYSHNIQEEKGTIFKENHQIIISAIMNACMMSPVREKEEVCIYILKNCLCDYNAKIQQIGLYVLFQEFLYGISPNEVCVKHINSIKKYIVDWKKLVTQKQDEKEVDFKKTYIEHWRIWNIWVSVSSVISYESLQNALDTIFLQSFDSVPIAYIMNKYGRE